MFKKVKSIVIVGFTHRKGKGGGNIHINNLIPFWESLGIKVIIFDPVNVNKFDMISALKATLQATVVKIDHVLEVNSCDLIISESPHPCGFQSCQYSRYHSQNMILMHWVHHTILFYRARQNQEKLIF